MTAPSGQRGDPAERHHHTHRAQHNRARGQDPMAVAEEFTRWAPTDVEQWLDDLADDPHVSDTQYANAQDAANTVRHSDADSDDDADGSG